MINTIRTTRAPRTCSSVAFWRRNPSPGDELKKTERAAWQQAESRARVGDSEESEDELADHEELQEKLRCRKKKAEVEAKNREVAEARWGMRRRRAVALPQVQVSGPRQHVARAADDVNSMLISRQLAEKNETTLTPSRAVAGTPSTRRAPKCSRSSTNIDLSRSSPDETSGGRGGLRRLTAALAGAPKCAGQGARTSGRDGDGLHPLSPERSACSR